MRKSCKRRPVVGRTIKLAAQPWKVQSVFAPIERASGCITARDMLKQINGQREFAMGVAAKWNQNGNPFAAIYLKGGA